MSFQAISDPHLQDRRALQKFARQIFALGAALQSVLMLVNGTILLFLDYHYQILGHDWNSGRYENGFWEFLQYKLRIETLEAYAIGATVFISGAYFIGNIAPYALIDKDRSLIVVAARTMLLPSLLSGFAMVFAFLLLRDRVEDIFVRQGKELFETIPVLSALYYVPGLITGMMAALLVRRHSIGQQERRRLAIRQDWDLHIHSPQ